MADIFSRDDAKSLLANKTLYFIGDSNIRAMYKDILQLLVNHRLTDVDALKSKMEASFNGDKLVLHGEKTNGTNYREERLFQADGISVFFYFITRCYNEYVESILKHMRVMPPDVVVYNSCLWDISRWGPKGVENYKGELPILLKRLQQVLSPNCLFLWATTLPVSQKMKGGFLVQEVDFLRHTLRFDVLEANVFASEVVNDHGFDVLDLHYYIQWQIHRRAQDGIHWQPSVVRHISNLILTHISLAWNRPLPNNFASNALIRVMQMDKEVMQPDSDTEEDQPVRRVIHCGNGNRYPHTPQNRFEPSFNMDFNFGGIMPSQNIGATLNISAPPNNNVCPNFGYVDFERGFVAPTLSQMHQPEPILRPQTPRMCSLQHRSPSLQQPLPINNFISNPFSVLTRAQNCSNYRQSYCPNPPQNFIPNYPQNYSPYRMFNSFPNTFQTRNQFGGGPVNNALPIYPWNEPPNNNYQHPRNKSIWL